MEPDPVAKIESKRTPKTSGTKTVVETKVAKIESKRTPWEKS